MTFCCATMKFFSHGVAPHPRHRLHCPVVPSMPSLSYGQIAICSAPHGGGSSVLLVHGARAPTGPKVHAKLQRKGLQHTLGDDIERLDVIDAHHCHREMVEVAKLYEDLGPCRPVERATSCGEAEGTRMRSGDLPTNGEREANHSPQA